LSSPTGPSEDFTMLATAPHAITIPPYHHHKPDKKFSIKFAQKNKIKAK